MEDKEDKIMTPSPCGLSSQKPSPTNNNRNRNKRKTNAKVVHDYHDFSRYCYDDYLKENPSIKKRFKENSVATFPEKLHQMLARVECDAMDNIVSWQPHGRAFRVHKPIDFVKMILPYYFKQSKFTSFQRQLNIYGFRRITTRKDNGAYYHELFLRGKTDLSKGMVRVKVKGTGRKGANNPEGEPDFYDMSHLPGLPHMLGTQTPPKSDNKVNEPTLRKMLQPHKNSAFVSPTKSQAVPQKNETMKIKIDAHDGFNGLVSRKSYKGPKCLPLATNGTNCDKENNDTPDYLTCGYISESFDDTDATFTTMEGDQALSHGSPFNSSKPCSEEEEEESPVGEQQNKLDLFSGHITPPGSPYSLEYFDFFPESDALGFSDDDFPILPLEE